MTRLEVWAQYGWDKDGRHLEWPWWGDHDSYWTRGDGWAVDKDGTSWSYFGGMGVVWRTPEDGPHPETADDWMAWVDREHPLPPPPLALGQGWLLEDGTQVWIIGVSPDGDFAAAVELATYPAPHDESTTVRAWGVRNYHRSALQQLPCITGPGAPWAPPTSNLKEPS